MLMKNINDNSDHGYGSNVVVLQSSILDTTLISFPYTFIEWLINRGDHQFVKLSKELSVTSEWSIYGTYGWGDAFFAAELGRDEPPFYTSVDDTYFLLIKGDGFIQDLIDNNNIRAFYTKWSVEDFISDFDLPNTTIMKRRLSRWNIKWPSD